ncbi:MAG TPA: phosphopantetheine-binding protein [Thermoleophilaceae bacterium]|jgi:acyl carrier protein
MAETFTPQAIEEALIDAMVTMGPEREEISREKTFEELDIDSLDLVELLQIAEERYGVELEAEDAKDVTTVGQAIDLVVGRVVNVKA